MPLMIVIDTFLCFSFVINYVTYNKINNEIIEKEKRREEDKNIIRGTKFVSYYY